MPIIPLIVKHLFSTSHLAYHCFREDEKWQPWSVLPPLFNAFLFKHAHQTSQENDSDSVVYPYKHHHRATNNYGFTSSQMKCTLTSDLWQAISAMLCCVMIIKCFKAVDQVVRGALGPDQPIWSPLLLSAPSWLFPCGLEIMASNIWGLVVSLKGRRGQRTESITSTSLDVGQYEMSELLRAVFQPCRVFKLNTCMWSV